MLGIFVECFFKEDSKGKGRLDLFCLKVAIRNMKKLLFDESEKETTSHDVADT